MSPARPRRILVIDDNRAQLELSRRVLSENGFDVHAAQSLVEFDKVLGDWSPDLILLDVNMPGMTGPEICATLKQRYNSAHVPVVLFSGLPEEELRELARECGADEALSKEDGYDALPHELDALCKSLLW